MNEKENEKTKDMSGKESGTVEIYDQKYLSQENKSCGKDIKRNDDGINNENNIENGTKYNENDNNNASNTNNLINKNNNDNLKETKKLMELGGEKNVKGFEKGDIDQSKEIDKDVDSIINNDGKEFLNNLNEDVSKNNNNKMGVSSETDQLNEVVLTY